VSAEIADVLDRAADRIERDGWWQGDYYEGADLDIYAGATLRLAPRPCCLTGALWAESGDAHAAMDVVSIIGDYVGNDLPAVWNDAPERTQAEVVAALRGAAAEERAS